MLLNHGCLFVPNKYLDKLSEEDLFATAKETFVGDIPKYPIFQETADGLYLPGGAATRLKALADIPVLKPDLGLSKKASPFIGKLRDYQEPAVTALKQAFDHTDRVMCEAACGSGKTVMGIYLAALLGEGSVMVLVDQRNIADQWEERLNTFIPDATVRKYSSSDASLDTYDPNIEFNIVLVHSLSRWDSATKEPLRVNMVIADEAHVFAAPTFIQAMLNLRFNKALGLTATADRKDGLAWVFRDFLGNETVSIDAPVLTPKVGLIKYTSPLKAQNYKGFWCYETRKLMCRAQCSGCKYETKFPACKVARNGLAVKYSDRMRLVYTTMIADVCMEEGYQALLHRLLEHVMDSDRQIMFFMAHRAPLEKLYEESRVIYGEDQVGLYVAKSPISETEKKLTFTTYKMSDKALDVPDKDTAILGSPIGDIRQTVGRILRSRPGKKQPLVLDPCILGLPSMQKHAKQRQQQYSAMGAVQKWITF